MASVSQGPPLVEDREERVRGAPLDDERVVISGVSGAYPQAQNVKELSENLYNKVSPITHNKLRWSYNHPDVPEYVIPGLDKFDVEFFKVKNRLGVTMDVTENSRAYIPGHS